MGRRVYAEKYAFKRREGFDLSSLRNIQYGGGPMPHKVVAAALEAFPATATIHRVYLADLQITPCGACRQVMRELMSDDSLVYSFGDGDDCRVWSANDYLPDVEEDEPEIHYISSIHGDEVVGMVLTLNFAHGGRRAAHQAVLSRATVLRNLRRAARVVQATGADLVAETATTGAIPKLVGGDTSMLYPGVHGVARQHGDGSFGLLHFSAHPDAERYGDHTISDRQAIFRRDRQAAYHALLLDPITAAAVSPRRSASRNALIICT